VFIKKRIPINSSWAHALTKIAPSRHARASALVVMASYLRCLWHLYPRHA